MSNSSSEPILALPVEALLRRLLDCRLPRLEGAQAAEALDARMAICPVPWEESQR